MLVTREMDYAIRAVRALDRCGQLSASAVAEREHMQPAMAYKVLKKLHKAGIVESRRGTEGGYLLEKDSGQLTLLDLFRALEEQLLMTECLKRGHCCANNAGGGCGPHREFCRIQRLLEAELRRTTLKTLFQTQEAEISEY